MFLYYLEVLGSIALFMLLGLFFSPFFGGCFGLILILFILSAVIIFFSINFIWFLLFGLAFYVLSWGLKYYRWYKLPKLDEYLEQNPQCKLSSAISCKHCNSDNIEHQGLFNIRSRWRFYNCKSCGQVLYKFTVL